MKTKMNMNAKTLDHDDVPLKTLYPKIKSEVKDKDKVHLKTLHPKVMETKVKSKVEVKVEDQKENKEDEEIVTQKDVFREDTDSK